eukprot:469486_1
MGNTNKMTQQTNEFEDGCYQECIVHGDGDHRNPMYESSQKDEYIVKCIGQLEANYKHKEFKSKNPQCGTGTVFYTNNEQPQKCYIITCAHNITMPIFACNRCGKYNKDQVNCCKSPLLYKVAITATNIQFRRREIEKITQHVNEDNEQVAHHFGDNKKCYDCKIEFANNEYKSPGNKFKNLRTTAGYDWCILSFINDDGYNYAKYCENIKIVNKQHEIKQQSIPKFHIYGYPMDEKNRFYKMYGHQSGTNNYSVETSKHSQKTYFKHKEVDTSPGQSGAAIWYKVDGNKHKDGETVIFAVHTGGNANKKYNVATLVDESILQKVNEIEDTNKHFMKKVNEIENTNFMKKLSFAAVLVILLAIFVAAFRNFQSNESNGYHEIPYKNGNTYNGELKAGKKHGYGNYTWKGGGSYEGYYENDKQHGQGKRIYSKGVIYKGEWKAGKKHGYGNYTWKGGGSYEGYYENDKQHGQGKRIYSKGVGSSYEGYFEKGKRSGKGKRIYSSGAIYDGGWAHDKKDGNGQLTYKNGTVVKEVWKNGKLLSRKRILSYPILSVFIILFSCFVVYQLSRCCV